MSWAIVERDHSQRRACALVGTAPKTCRHVPARPDDAVLGSTLRELANERRRFGWLHRRSSGTWSLRRAIRTSTS